MMEQHFFPWIAINVKTPEELDQFIVKNYSINTNPKDSGFDKTLAIIEAHRNSAEMVRTMYAYLMETLQISNFLNYVQGKDYIV